MGGNYLAGVPFRPHALLSPTLLYLAMEDQPNTNRLDPYGFLSF